MEKFNIKANAPQRVCEDPKCPYHGVARVRGRILKGKILSAKMRKTVVVGYDFLKFFPKYNRYGKNRTKVYAHLPSCIEVKVGDEVIVGETKPLSKMKNFVVLKVLSQHEKADVSNAQAKVGEKVAAQGHPKVRAASKKKAASSESKPKTVSKTKQQPKAKSTKKDSRVKQKVKPSVVEK